MNRQFAEFTEAGYRSLLERARASYRFEPFGTREHRPHVLWRHDVDLSVHRAQRIAEIDHEAEIRSTFFFLPHSEFYNLLERGIAARVRKIMTLRHHLGLHFDPSFYAPGSSARALEQRLSQEKRLLEDLAGEPVRVFSLHDPKPASLRALARDRIAGMINAYGRGIGARYKYSSDSNGYWRHRRLMDLLDPHRHPRLHVLTHPCWWTPSPMSPWRRVKRCIDGRARFVERFYDASLKRDRRVNLGR